MVLGILGSVYAWQSDWTSERMTEAAAIRKANHQHVGPAKYGSRVVDGLLVDDPDEDLSVVIEAYRATGAFQATARKLNADKVPTRTGKPWAATSVRTIMEREKSEILPLRRKKSKVSGAFRFSGLLRCPHDGALLTGRTFRGRYVAYACRRAPTDPTHPRPYTIAEPAILAWARDEAAHLRVPIAAVTDGEPADRDAYEAERRALLTQHRKGYIGDDELDAALEAMAEEYKFKQVRMMAVPPAIEWDEWTPAEINTALRGLWTVVELADDLRPVRAEWRAPEWRA